MKISVLLKIFNYHYFFLNQEVQIYFRNKDKN